MVSEEKSFENVNRRRKNGRRTDRRWTTDGEWSQKLILSICSGELKTKSTIKPILSVHILDCLITINLTQSPPNKLSFAKFLFFNIQSASMLLKVCENVVCVSNSLDPDETPGYSVSHPDPSILFAYGTTVVLGGLRVNAVWKNSEFHVLVQRNFGDTIFTSCPIKLKFTSIIGRF